MPRHLVFVVALLLLVLFPLLAQAAGQNFYIGFATRVMIFALAASSLNLVLGFAGMVSFGHAAFFGAGAYTVAILAQHGVTSAAVAWPAAILVSAGFALLIGALSLRTRGAYFIMITLAFAQMVYYLFVSLKAYGGDDGLTLPGRSSLGFGLDLKNDSTFYYVTLLCLVSFLFLFRRLIAARFGRALCAIKENEIRAEAIGFPVFALKLVAFVASGACAGLAGALIANQNVFVSPSLMHWTQSGMLMVMVIVGGIGRLYGGVFGAVILLLLEETLPAYTEHWQLPVGLMLLLIVFFAPSGIAGWFAVPEKNVREQNA
jgi:branched-chain amino acid transport system permease protein